jgi:hypothetical protein
MRRILKVCVNIPPIEQNHMGLQVSSGFDLDPAEEGVVWRPVVISWGSPQRTYPSKSDENYGSGQSLVYCFMKNFTNKPGCGMTSPKLWRRPWPEKVLDQS